MNPFHTNFKHYIPLAAKDPNIPLNVCKCSTEKTYSTRDIGTQTIRKCYSKSSTLLPDYKKKLSCRHRGLNPQRTFYAIIFQLLCQPYYRIVIANTKSCIRNKEIRNQLLFHVLYLSDDRIRLKFCESTVKTLYANGQQSRVQLKIRRVLRFSK